MIIKAALSTVNYGALKGHNFVRNNFFNASQIWSKA